MVARIRHQREAGYQDGEVGSGPSRPVAHPQHLRAMGFEFFDAQSADALQLR